MLRFKAPIDYGAQDWNEFPPTLSTPNIFFERASLERVCSFTCESEIFNCIVAGWRMRSLGLGPRASYVLKRC